jgi:hypothetical protein
MDSVNRTWVGMGPATCRMIFSNFPSFKIKKIMKNENIIQ